MEAALPSEIRISVVIPAWNAAATIVGAVESCLGQSLPPLEVIVANDGSTDETEALLLAHFGSRIRYLRLPVNSGPAAARNAGIAVARGGYIAFQDADDRWHPDKLRILTTALLTVPGISFLWHPYTLRPLPPEFPAAAGKPRPFSWWKLLLSNPIGTPCVLLRNHAGLRFHEKMHHTEDHDLWLREGWKSGIWRIDAALTQVQRPILSAGGQSSNRWKMRRGELRAYARLWRLQPVLLVLWPVLAAGSLAKHFFKSFRPPRSNY